MRSKNQIMYLLKTLSDTVVVFEEDNLLFLKQKNPLKRERLALALVMILFAWFELSLKPPNQYGFSFFSWILLLVVWIVYFFYYLLKRDYPDKLSFSEIIKVRILHRKKIFEIEIYDSQKRRPLRLSTDSLDEKWIALMEEKKITMESWKIMRDILTKIGILVGVLLIYLIYTFLKNGEWSRTEYFLMAFVTIFNSISLIVQQQSKSND